MLGLYAARSSWTSSAFTCARVNGSLPSSAAQPVALLNHLTFAACRAGAGSAYLFNELIELVYVTFFVQDAGYRNTDVNIHARAEAALEPGLQRAEVERRWGF